MSGRGGPLNPTGDERAPSPVLVLVALALVTGALAARIAIYGGVYPPWSKHPAAVVLP